MLFSKTIEPRCAYCQRGKTIDEETVLCKKRGVMAAEDSCRSYRYDPLKRTPPRLSVPDFSRLKEEDFTL